MSLCWWLIGSSLGRDPFWDCGMNFSARRRHAGPNVNPYHCAYTTPPIHTCNATLNPIVTSSCSLPLLRTVHSAVVIKKMSSLLGPLSAPPFRFAAAASPAVSDVGSARPEAVGVTFVVGRLSPPSWKGGGASESWQRDCSHATHTHVCAFAYICITIDGAARVTHIVPSRVGRSSGTSAFII